MQGVLDLTREQLLELTWRGDNDDLTKPMANDMGKIRNLLCSSFANKRKVSFRSR